MTNPTSAFDRLLSDRKGAMELAASAAPGGALNEAAMRHIKPIEDLARHQGDKIVDVARATATKFQGAFSPLDPKDGQVREALVGDIISGVSSLLPQDENNYLARAINNTVFKAVSLRVGAAFDDPAQTWDNMINTAFNDLPQQVLHALDVVSSNLEPAYHLMPESPVLHCTMLDSVQYKNKHSKDPIARCWDATVSILMRERFDDDQDLARARRQATRPMVS